MRCLRNFAKSVKNTIGDREKRIGAVFPLLWGLHTLKPAEQLAASNRPRAPSPRPRSAAPFPQTAAALLDTILEMSSKR